MKTKLNKSDFILLGTYYAISILMSIHDYNIRENDFLEYVLDIPAYVVLDIAMIYFFMYWLIPKYIINKQKYIYFAIWGVIIMAAAGIIDRTIGFYSGGGDWNKFHYDFNLFVSSISNTAESIGLPFGLLLAKKYYENQIQFSTIKQQQKENELKLLRSQISPHFLFNNLNTLDALIDSDTEKAKEYVNRLSLIYRYLIQTKDAEVMELTEEMNLAENYMFLIKTRFGNDYEFDIVQNVPLQDKFVPTGAIQTLLENIAKHNRAQHGKPIKASMIIDEDWLTITNTKSNIKPTQESLGTGLKNLKYRYSLLSDQTPIIIDTANEFNVKIPIIKLSKES